MEHEIHEPDTDHGGVEVVAVERSRAQHFPLALVRELVAHQAALHTVLVGVAELLARVLGQDVLVGPQQKASRAAGGVAYFVTQLGINQGADHLDDVTRGAELTVFAGGCDLRK